MATTANGTPYVESSDLVADYPAVSLALAEHIDDTSTILQVVRATDTTDRTTTSTSFVDVTGMSVTITPQRTTSAVLLIATMATAAIRTTLGDARIDFQITDSSNNAVSGANTLRLGVADINAVISSPFVMVGYATPATISAVTYKVRYKSLSSTTTAAASGAFCTSQLFAIEVSA